MKKLFKPALALATVLAVACGGNNSQTTTDHSTHDHTSHDHAATTGIPAGEPTTTSTEAASDAVVIESDDQMKFNKSEIKVKAGENVTITLKHVGKTAKEVMGHNLVILKPGTDIPAFGVEANEAKDTDYIPASLASSVIGHSKVIGGGEQDSFEVTLEAGKYDFVCSFPGHLAIMKGVIIAE